MDAPLQLSLVTLIAPSHPTLWVAHSPACPANTYKSSIGGGSCTPCTANAYTSNTASTSINDCKCYDGYYGSGNTTCTSMAQRDCRA